MNAMEVKPISDWSVLLDELKTKEGLASDAKLAALLGVTPGYICSVRKGRKGVSQEIAQAILQRLGRTLDTASLKQLFVPIKVQQRARFLALLREQVLQRAQGHCQLCEMPAPFMDADGNPYLEIHHVVSPQNGGSSTIDNLVALCPNCHVKFQVNASAAEKMKLQMLAAQYKKQQLEVDDDPL